MQSNLIVITGSSGVGKSTLAKALQEALLPDVWLHFSVDAIFCCLPASVVQRVDQENDLAAVDSGAIVASAYACARVLLEQGHRVIFDAVVLSAKGATRLLDAFCEHQPVMVELTCAWEKLRERTLARGDRTLEEAEHGFRNARGHLDSRYSFDSTAVSPDDIAAQLVAYLRSGQGAA